MQNYYYELKYKNDDNEIIYKFNADIDCYKMQEHLQNFLLASSWNNDVLKDIFKEEVER